jgi:hypothetical protein
MLDRNCVLILSVLHLSIPFYVSITQKIIRHEISTCLFPMESSVYKT